MSCRTVGHIYKLDAFHSHTHYMDAYNAWMLETAKMLCTHGPTRNNKIVYTFLGYGRNRMQTFARE